MATRRRQAQSAVEPASSEGVAITVDGQTYMSIERACAYIGRKRATVFNYVKKYGWETFTFRDQGKRTFIRKSDLDAWRTPTAEPKPRKVG